MQQLLEFANNVAGKAGEFLLAFAAVGALTMAVLQTIKELTPARPLFHQWFLLKWLRTSVRVPRVVPADGTDGAHETDEQRRQREEEEEQRRRRLAVCLSDQLIELATAGDAKALYALETEKLAAQLSAAAAMMVDYPSRHHGLLRCLAVHADSTDIDEMVKVESAGRSSLDTLRKERPHEFDAFLDGKARVTHHIQRNIDAFQISASFRWKWILQLASFTVSFLLAIIGLAFFDSKPGFDSSMLAGSIPVALAAGFIAPIARDLISIIEPAKRK